MAETVDSALGAGCGEAMAETVTGSGGGEAEAETVFLGLGSNEGDRRAMLDMALSALTAELGCAPVAVSDYMQTPSWGFEAPDFLNAVAAFELENVDPLGLLEVCKKIERQMGRKENVEYDTMGKRVYHSRPIDIDILLIGDRKIDCPTLTVPHPLMEQRDFVMVPLRQVKSILVRKD